MERIHCKACGKQYDYRTEGCCPNCGAYNRPPRREWVDADGSIRMEAPRRTEQNKPGKVCYEQKECHEKRTHSEKKSIVNKEAFLEKKMRNRDIDSFGRTRDVQERRQAKRKGEQADRFEKEPRVQDKECYEEKVCYEGENRYEESNRQQAPAADQPQGVKKTSPRAANKQKSRMATVLGILAALISLFSLIKENTAVREPIYVDDFFTATVQCGETVSWQSGEITVLGYTVNEDSELYVLLDRDAEDNSVWYAELFSESTGEMYQMDAFYGTAIGFGYVEPDTYQLFLYMDNATIQVDPLEQITPEE